MSVSFHPPLLHLPPLKLALVRRVLLDVGGLALLTGIVVLVIFHVWGIRLIGMLLLWAGVRAIGGRDRGHFGHGCVLHFEVRVGRRECARGAWSKYV